MYLKEGEVFSGVVRYVLRKPGSQVDFSVTYESEAELWAWQFRKDPLAKSLSDCVNGLKGRGYAAVKIEISGVMPVKKA